MRLRNSVFHILIVLTPIVLLVWLFVIDLTPSGRFSTRVVAGERSPYLDRFLPADRALEPERGPDGKFQRIVDEPVYASVHLPGEFDTMDVHVEFQNDDQPIVEVGLLVNDDPPQYVLEPLQNLLIDDSDWDRMEENGVVLLQREKIYGSITDFLANPPDRDTIATYHYHLDDPYRIQDYRPSNEFATVHVPLIGYHEFYTYVKDEPLSLSTPFFVEQSLEGDRSLTILVYNEQGELVASAGNHGGECWEAPKEVCNQFGCWEDSVACAPGTPYPLGLVAELPEGVYKVVLKASDRIRIRSIVTRQRFLSFVGPVHIGPIGSWPTVTFFTNGKHLRFYGDNGGSPERIEVGEGTVETPLAQTWYAIDVTEPGVVESVAHGSEFVIASDGKIAFSKDQFFDPDPARLNWNTDLDALDVNFVIAEYASPTKNGDWMSVGATFDLAGAVDENGVAKLVLAAPGVEELQQEIRVHAVELSLKRSAMSFGEILKKIKELF